MTQSPTPTDAPSSFRLDGQAVPVAGGDTILTAAARAGIAIPHLCWHEGVSHGASCRLCTVHVAGKAVAACSTAAAPGMDVQCNTPALDTQRRHLLQMLFVEGNHFCPGCEKSGSCQLQHQAAQAGMTELHYETLRPQRQVDATHPDVFLDRNRCILCQLCVRASDELDGKQVFAIAGHGLGARLVVNSPSGQLGDSAIAASDQAVAICPVGALLPKRRGFAVPIGQRAFDTDETPT